jgi:hypothetical protein
MNIQKTTYNNLLHEINKLEEKYNKLDSLLYYHMDDYNLISKILNKGGHYVDLIRVPKQHFPPFSQKSLLTSKLIKKMQKQKAKYEKMIPIYLDAFNIWKKMDIDARKHLYDTANADKIKEYEQRTNGLHTTYFSPNNEIKTFDEILKNYKPFSIGGGDNYYYKYMKYNTKYNMLDI